MFAEDVARIERELEAAKRAGDPDAVLRAESELTSAQSQLGDRVRSETLHRILELQRELETLNERRRNLVIDIGNAWQSGSLALRSTAFRFAPASTRSVQSSIRSGFDAYYPGGGALKRLSGFEAYSGDIENTTAAELPCGPSANGLAIPVISTYSTSSNYAPTLSVNSSGGFTLNSGGTTHEQNTATTLIGGGFSTGRTLLLLDGTLLVTLSGASGWYGRADAPADRPLGLRQMRSDTSACVFTTDFGEIDGGSNRENSTKAHLKKQRLIQQTYGNRWLPRAGELHVRTRRFGKSDSTSGRFCVAVRVATNMSPSGVPHLELTDHGVVERFTTLSDDYSGLVRGATAPAPLISLSIQDLLEREGNLDRDWRQAISDDIVRLTHLLNGASLRIREDGPLAPGEVFM